MGNEWHATLSPGHRRREPDTTNEMASGTPTTADFSSSSPLKRTKIVLLGDQSVGKTSLITRQASFTIPEYVTTDTKIQVYV
jgi:hypothetical protein